jgi:translation initiation factor IF-2
MVKLYVALRWELSEKVLFTGDLLALKRFKDDVKDVAKGYDCGIQVKVQRHRRRDVIESYHGSS